MIIVCPVCNVLIGREGSSNELSYSTCTICKEGSREETPQDNSPKEEES